MATKKKAAKKSAKAKKPAKPAATKKAAKKTAAKAAKSGKKVKYACQVCGKVVTIDECGCAVEEDIICCGEPMERQG